MDHPGFFFCITHDSQHLIEYVEKHFLKPLQSKQPEISIFWGDEGLSPKFWEKFSLTSFLCDFRIIILRWAERLTKEEWLQLSSKLAQCSSSVLPIFCLEGEWGDKKKTTPTSKDRESEDDYFLPNWKGKNDDGENKGDAQITVSSVSEHNTPKGSPKKTIGIKKFHELPCYRCAKKFNWLWKSEGINPTELKKHLQNQAKQRGITLTQDSVNYLSQIILPDTATINSFFEQLILSSEKNIFDIDDVRKVSTLNQEAVIFEIITQLESGTPAILWKNILDKSEEADSFFFPFIALLAREIRILWQIKSNNVEGIPSFIIQKKSILANNISFSTLAAMFEKIALSEYNIKAGNYTSAQSLTILVADLFDLFRHHN